MEAKRKNNRELFQSLSVKIAEGDYFFTNHAKQRLKERELLEFEILDILIGKRGKKRRRNKGKENYTPGNQDWNYCIEGIDVSERKIRIIFSFSEENIAIITAIKINLAW
ncbi:MAG: DUF4258 domain-containing protein [Gammaproteobacteria bacterium]|nr:DUF4258 domain-containing protein [Gammaproteobacteria bacterium]